MLDEDDVIDLNIYKCSLDGFKFKLFEAKTKSGGYDISVHNADDKENPEYCLQILTHPDNGITPYEYAGDAVLQSINYYGDCTRTGLRVEVDENEIKQKFKNNKKKNKKKTKKDTEDLTVRKNAKGEKFSGTILLKLALVYLKRYKDKYKIKRIVLQDNSKKRCTYYIEEEKMIDGKLKKINVKVDKEIDLGLLHTLKTGHTWYGAYGFRPYDSTTKSINIVANQDYEENIETVNKQVTKTTLFGYLKEIYIDNMSEKEAMSDAQDDYSEELEEESLEEE
jgi:hypothetical protein